MNSKNILIGIIVVVLLVLLGAYSVSKKDSTYTPTPGTTACTMEAKMCPDGSSVGRSGPRCEFTACPVVVPATGTISVTAMLQQGVMAFGTTIMPIEVVEDSRCPIDVTCIQAGTVRVRANVTTGASQKTEEFKLMTPIVRGSQTIELVVVNPVKNSKVQTTSAQYRFTFKVTQR